MAKIKHDMTPICKHFPFLDFTQWSQPALSTRITDFFFFFNKVEESVRKAWFLFILFYRTTFGVDKPVFVSEKQQQKKSLTRQIHSKKVRAFNYSYSVSKAVHLNRSAVMASTKKGFGLHKVTWRIPHFLRYQILPFILGVLYA